MKQTIIILSAIILSSNIVKATKWYVGPTRTYTLPSQVKPLIQNNDTIYFDGAVYLNDPVKWDKKNLKFIGLGTGTNRSIMRWNAGDIANGKGLWVFELPGTSDNASIENIVFDGARVSDADGANGAGIRYQAKDLTIKNCKFMNCQNGILEGNNSITNSNCIIEGTEFENNGYEVIGNSSYSGYEHHIYMSASLDTLIVKNCYFHDPRGEANSLKTRAQRSYILNNVIDEGLGQGSAELNIAQGGLTIAMGNIIIQGPNSINHGIIGYDAATNPIEDFYFINNTVINKFVGNVRYFTVPSSGINTFKVYNNIFSTVSGASITFMQGSVGLALDSLKNHYSTNYNTFGFVNPTSNDYHLTSGALSAINKGTSAGVASSGYALTPTNEYVNFSQALNPRSIIGGAIDLGAYEFGTVATGIPFVYYTELPFYVSYAEDEIELHFQKQIGHKTITLYDVAGRTVNLIVSNNDSSIKIHKKDLPKGLYLLSYNDEDSKKCIQKIIID